jgi:prevent-host-death family protein
MMVDAVTVSATEFKATCLDILDRLADRRLERVEVTKRGRVVAVLIPPAPRAVRLDEIHGFMAGSVVSPAAVDLTLPVLEDGFEAELGLLHR